MLAHMTLLLVLPCYVYEDRVILTGRLLLASTMVFTYPLECFVARHSLCALLQLNSRGGGEGEEEAEDEEQGVRDLRADSIDDIVLELEPETGRGRRDSRQGQQQAGTRAGRRRLPGGGEGEGGDDGEGLPLGQHVMFTLGLWGSSLLLALVVSDLHLILALTGSVAASLLAFVLPALIYLKTHEAHLVKAKAGFDPASNHYQPSVLRRVGKLWRFVFPFLLLLFGVLSLVVGVGTVVYEVAH